MSFVWFWDDKEDGGEGGKGGGEEEEEEQEEKEEDEGDDEEDEGENDAKLGTPSYSPNKQNNFPHSLHLPPIPPTPENTR